MQDVLIIGGGPVGSHIAASLARAGFKVTVLEKKEEPGGPVCCTGLIGAACLVEFDIDDSLVLRWFKGARIFSPSGRILRIFREKEQACVIDRAGLDVLFARRASKAGVQYHYSTRVTGLHAEDDRIVAEAGGKYHYRARAAVIATGFNRTLLKSQGLGPGRHFAIGAQAEVEVPDSAEAEVYLGNRIAPGFFGWLVPTKPGMALVGLISRRHPDLYFKSFVESLAHRGKIKGAIAEPLYRGVTLRPPHRTFGNRLIVVGDAAGQVKPLTGGGLYYGLLSADLAARRLERALKRDNLSAAALAGYEQAWKWKLGVEINICFLARRLYERLADGQIEAAFDIIKDNSIGGTLSANENLSFDWHSRAVLSLAGCMVVPGAARLLGVR